MLNINKKKIREMFETVKQIINDAFEEDDDDGHYELVTCVGVNQYGKVVTYLDYVWFED